MSRFHRTYDGLPPVPMKREGEANAEDGVVQGKGGEAAR